MPGEREQTAAALLLPRQYGGHLIVGLRRNPRAGRRPWLVQLSNWRPFTIRGDQLLSRSRFNNVMWNALFKVVAESTDRDALDNWLADLASLPEQQLVWRYYVAGLVEALGRLERAR